MITTDSRKGYQEDDLDLKKELGIDDAHNASLHRLYDLEQD